MYDPWEIDEDYDPRRICPRCGSEISGHYCGGCGWPSEERTSGAVDNKVEIKRHGYEVVISVNCDSCSAEFKLRQNDVDRGFTSCPSCGNIISVTKQEIEDAALVMMVGQNFGPDCTSLGQAIWEYVDENPPPGQDYETYIQQRMDSAKKRYERGRKSPLKMHRKKNKQKKQRPFQQTNAFKYPETQQSSAKEDKQETYTTESLWESLGLIRTISDLRKNLSEDK